MRLTRSYLLCHVSATQEVLIPQAALSGRQQVVPGRRPAAWLLAARRKRAQDFNGGRELSLVRTIFEMSPMSPRSLLLRSCVVREAPAGVQEA